MNRIFKLSLSILILAGFSGLAAAQGYNNQTDIAYLNNHSEAAGGVVEVCAKVISINADSKSMELFDSQSRKMIQVNLTQLRKSERSALVRSGARRVMVSGRASMIGGRMVIDAQRVEARPLEVEAKAETTVETGSEIPR